MNPVMGPTRLDVLAGLGDLLAVAAETAVRRTQQTRRRRRTRSGYARRPGADSPLWNVLAAELRAALAPHGAKARLARYLGLPRQRLTDFLTGRRRLPDAELTLRLLHWYAEQRAGRDPAL